MSKPTFSRAELEELKIWRSNLDLVKRIQALKRLLFQKYLVDWDPVQSTLMVIDGVGLVLELRLKMDPEATRVEIRPNSLGWIFKSIPHQWPSPQEKDDHRWHRYNHDFTMAILLYIKELLLEAEIRSSKALEFSGGLSEGTGPVPL